MPTTRSPYAAYRPNQTPQTEPVRPDQTKNLAGGYGWQVTDFEQLDRFLILGTEGNAYYAGQEKLTRDNAKAVERCLQADGLRTVARICAISETNRAPKNTPAIFALAMAASLGDEATRRAALFHLHAVCRTGTHLIQFVQFMETFRGWGRAAVNGVARWFTETPPDKLAYQVMKYKSRKGVDKDGKPDDRSLRDIIRLCHAHKPGDELVNAIIDWTVHGWPDVGIEPHPDRTLARLWAAEYLRKITNEIIVQGKQKPTAAWLDSIAALIVQFHLPREVVPTELFKHKAIWEALLEDMPMTALIRALPQLTNHGLLESFSTSLTKVLDQLDDKERIVKARVHPIQVLSAMLTYASGHSQRGSSTWTPNDRVITALDKAFYHAFGSVQPTGKKVLYALDISGSMTSSQTAIPGITPAMGQAALAMVNAAVEKDFAIVGFDTVVHAEYQIGPGARLDSVMQKTAGITGNGTDCAAPIKYAKAQKWELDAIVMFTDNQTWAGTQHVTEALMDYRRQNPRPVKVVGVAMVPYGNTILDPTDPLCLNLVGFDSAGPQLINDFITDGHVEPAPEIEDEPEGE